MTELHKDHVHLEKVFNILDQQIELLSSDSNPDYYLMADITNYIQNYPDLIHHPKENRVYDVYKQRSNEAADIVAQLQKDHQTLPVETNALQNLLETAANSAIFLSRNKIQDEVKNFLRIERKHMNLEENILFPLILKTLTDDDWKILESDTTEINDPLFGGSIEARYKNLYESIKRQG